MSVPRFVLCLLPFAFCLSSPAAIDESKLPPASTNQVDFDRDIQPIFEKSCLRCHGPEKPKSRFRLDNQESAWKGGEQGVDILPGQSAKSPLIHFAARLVEDMEMPPSGKGDPLTPEQVGLLRAWIDQGAKYSAARATGRRSASFTLTSGVSAISVSGDERKFRERYWRKEGVAGGLEEFELREPVGKDTTLTLNGRALFDESDYKLSFDLRKNELGYVRAGVGQYKKYFDDTGGYYPNFARSSFDLNRDLDLTVGRAWAEIGLTRPHWPQLSLGYEYQYKDGDKSTLQWGPVSSTASGVGPFANYYPAAKNIDEKVHIIKFDANHTLRGWYVEDNFRGEFYKLDTARINDVSFPLTAAGPVKLITVKEGATHFQGANTIRVEKWFKDWFFASAGYLYSHLDGDASFNSVTIATGAGGPAGGLFPDRQWSANQILLEQQTHAFSVGSLLGPWNGFTLSAAGQGEWTRTEGFGNVRLDQGPLPIPVARPATVSANNDRNTWSENVGVRFTSIPFTVLYAEGTMQQERIGQFEQQLTTDAFLRDTDATSDLRQYRAGFNTSPWERISLGGAFTHRERDSDYDHLRDTGVSSDGYSAFIRAREIESDTIEGRLVFKAARWLKTTFKYQLVASDYTTVTDPVNGGGANSPGGEVFAGNYDAHVYSVSAIITPLPRLYLNPSLSYSDARTKTFANNNPAIVPYRGNVYTVLAAATYILNDKTDLNATYSFSRADFGQNNLATALPLGLNYTEHGLQAGLTRRLRKNISASLHYGYYKYDEPSSGGLNNYTAHAVFASMTLRWP